jgi:hypothetical protein
VINLLRELGRLPPIVQLALLIVVMGVLGLVFAVVDTIISTEY